MTDLAAATDTSDLFDVKGLFDLTPCGLAICDGAGRILRANALFRDITGHAGEAVAFSTYLTRPSRFIFAAKLLPHLQMTGEAREIAVDLTGPDGAPVAVLVNATRRETADGIQQYFAVFPARGRRELERQHIDAKRELIQSRDYLQLAEKLAHVGHWRVDMMTKAVYWSPEIFSIYGIDPAGYAPVMNGTIDFYHPDDREDVKAAIADAIERKSDFTFRKRLIQAGTNDVRVVQASGICECDPNGNVVALFGVFHDVTDMARAQARIEESEARYRLLADHANDIITTFDVSGRFEYLSPAITKVLGYAPEELSGSTVRQIIHPDDFPATQKAYEAYVVGRRWRRSPRIQYRARHKDGRYIWVEAHPTAVLSAKGCITGLQDVIRDISAQKATEIALETARVEANAAAEAKAQFLATMSHELRTPLTSIIGFSSLLRDLLAHDATLAKHSQRIHSAGQGLLGLINDILDHSKLEAGQLELDLAPCDIAEVAHEVTELLGVQAGAKGLDLVVHGVEDLPPALMIDEGRVRQIMLNLMGNAIKFTATGRVTLTVAIRPTGANAEALRVCVRDTGVGISDAGQARLFQRFSQVDHNRDGTGLGLMICKQLIELMHGEIGVTSREGQGSEFWFEIPATRVAQVSATDIQVLPARILIVDDQDAVRDLVAGLLPGHDLTMAENGAVALDACRGDVFDLIFMDINMPVMDGLAAAHALRSGNGPNASTPIIAMTAAAGEDRYRACLAAGMNDLLPKPLKPAALNAVMSEWLGDPEIPFARTPVESLV